MPAPQKKTGYPVGMRYKADITAGSLKVPESRVIADLCSRGRRRRAGSRPSKTRTSSRPAARDGQAARRPDPATAGDHEPKSSGSWSATVRQSSPPTPASPPPSSTAPSLATSSIWSSGSNTGSSARRSRTTLWETLHRRLPGPRSRDAGVERIDDRAAAVVGLPDPCPGRVHREHTTLKLQTVTLPRRCCATSRTRRRLRPALHPGGTMSDR